MKTKLCILIFLLTAAWASAQTNSLTALLQQGLFEEQANQNLDAAIANYQSLATQFDKDRQLAATAVFRIGECYRMQGKTNEAAVQYERILKDFSDQTTLATLSRQNLTGMGMSPDSTANSDILQRLFSQRQKELAGQVAANSDDEAQEIQRIQTMIQNSPDLINVASAGSTPLVQAAYNGWTKVAAYLLDHGAGVNVSCFGIIHVPDLYDGNATHITPLAAAVIAGNKAMTQLLIDRGADVNFKGLNGNTPLHLAAKKGFQAVTEVLLANHAEVDARNDFGATPLFFGVQSGQLKIVQMLLAGGADVNFKDSEGRTVLNYAIGFSPEIFQALLAAGTNPNTEDSAGRTPLSYAVERAGSGVVKLLLDAKAGPNGGKLNAPIFEAIKRGDTNTLELLLQAGANPNAEGRIDWQINFDNSFSPQRALITPLFLAVSMNQLPTAKLLLKFKADPDDSKWDSRSILFLVLDKPEFVKALLEAGANAEASEWRNIEFRPGQSQQHQHHQTLLQAAAGQNQPETVALLLQHGANPNAREERGDTVLHYAAFNLSDEKVFALLLNHKADPNLRNNDGKTPLDLVREWQQNKMQGASPEQIKLAGELIDLLHQHGALDNPPEWDRITVSRPTANFLQTVFQKGTNDWNQFTLLETIVNLYAGYGQYLYPGHSILFPDLARIVIVRPNHHSTNVTRIPVNLLNSTNGVDCSKDVPLEFGDVVEIPERDHALGAPAVGLTDDERNTIWSYLKGNVQLVVHGQKYEIPISPSANSSLVDTVLQKPEAQKILLSSSDLSRVKVVRRDAKTGKNHEWTVDCSKAIFNPDPDNARDLWLRNGDVIEVPEK